MNVGIFKENKDILRYFFTYIFKNNIYTYSIYSIYWMSYPTLPDPTSPGIQWTIGQPLESCIDTCASIGGIV